jgi:hypothetical protein
MPLYNSNNTITVHLGQNQGGDVDTALRGVVMLNLYTALREVIN